jgi:two-component system, sensor histidine kinase YesM
MSVSSDDTSLNYSLQMVEDNMESLLENINDSSKTVAYNTRIQEILAMGASMGYEERASLQNELEQIMACNEGISSIYLFDTKGESYTVGNIYEVEEIRSYLLRYAPYRFSLNASTSGNTGTQIFTYESTMDEGRLIISFVRQILDLNTMDNRGLLAINISSDKIAGTFANVLEQNDMEIAILDKEKQLIAGSSGGEWLRQLAEEGAISSDENSYIANSTSNKSYRVGMLADKDQEWIVAAAIKKGQALHSMRGYVNLSVLFLLLGMFLCVFGATVITRRLERPLNNILASMSDVKKNNFEHIELVETNEEMDELQVQYNHMLDETKELLNQKVEEQRSRRKYELSLLQEQIKPHFLYNTFDSVCSLAKMGRTKDVYTMMQALGQYYRNSLHKGQQIIEVRDELNIVENYLIIQSFRYDDVFDVDYDIDDNILQEKTVKLILQPLVENAIYHGFRDQSLQGTITIRAKDDGDYVRFQVEDDGAGIPREKLDQILHSSEDNQGKRFGLYGTIQRIQLFYEEKDLVQIESDSRWGTVIRVRIPKKGVKE